MRAAARAQRWLRAARDVAGLPSRGAGCGAKLAERIRARCAMREQQAAGCRSAGCRSSWPPSRHSPNGVVLLDAQGRIEWCNQTAADQFGFDLQRDLMQQVTNLVRDPAFAAYYSGGSYEP